MMIQHLSSCPALPRVLLITRESRLIRMCISPSSRRGDCLRRAWVLSCPASLCRAIKTIWTGSQIYRLLSRARIASCWRLIRLVATLGSLNRGTILSSMTASIKPACRRAEHHTTSAADLPTRVQSHSRRSLPSARSADAAIPPADGVCQGAAHPNLPGNDSGLAGAGPPGATTTLGEKNARMCVF